MEVNILRKYTDVLQLVVEADSLEDARRREQDGEFDNETWVAADGWLEKVVYRDNETGEEITDEQQV